MIQILLGKYDARALAFKITYQSDIRTTDQYNDAMDEMVDATMSCNRREAIKWLIKYMEDAISYGISTQNKDWKYRYLAAYDLCKGL